MVCLSKISVACRLHTLKEQRFQIPKGLRVTPSYVSSPSWLHANFSLVHSKFISYEHTVVGICYRYTGQIGTFIRYMCYYSIKTIFAYLFTPYFNPISKETSTESNEADEIYLLSRTKRLYIIFQHIDKPFYLKFWMQCMSYIKTISTL